MREVVFILFSVVTLGFAIAVVVANSPLFSVFALLCSLLGLGGMHLAWGSSFASILQILVYTGTLLVLFIFVMRLLGKDRQPGIEAGWIRSSITAIILWMFSSVLLRVLNRTIVFRAPGGPSQELRTVPSMLFHEYLWAFEVLSIFFLATVVAVYCLVRARKEDT